MSNYGVNILGIGGGICLAGLLLGSGCERAPAPVPISKPPVVVVVPPAPPAEVPPAEVPPAPVVIPLEAGNETVNLKEINRPSNIRVVRGDFNPDDYKDVATVREVSGKEIEIAVYLGRKEVDFYSKAGSVRRTLSGKLVGFMTSRPGQYMDLVILVGHSNAPNEVIHFRNDGTRFEEIETVVSGKTP